ncbi:eclosion hormone-like [Anoplophora glabripennis]|uniref:eclosion hormone-like n=1 Tax=Anoplophora glabripennis TaxID=217634 RepID=UPI000873C456|nr:eclosion hormone-like [Anoplophora glabripennis]
MVCQRNKMLGVVAFLLLASMVLLAEANPIGVCIRNCAQCKKMFGPYFEGQLCADACVKFKGKIIPDCEDIASIAPFLNKFD